MRSVCGYQELNEIYTVVARVGEINGLGERLIYHGTRRMSLQLRK